MWDNTAYSFPDPLRPPPPLFTVLGSITSARFRLIKCRKYGILTPVSMRNIVFSGVTPRDLSQIHVRDYVNVCV